MDKNALKKIFGISKALGMDNEELHLMCSAVTGQDSLRKLDRAQTSALIRELEKRQTGSGTGNTAPAYGKAYKTDGMSQEQCRKVFAQIYELAKYDSEPSTATAGERVCGVIQKCTGKLTAPAEPFARLSAADGQRLIEMLNRYITSAALKASKMAGSTGCHDAT